MIAAILLFSGGCKQLLQHPDTTRIAMQIFAPLARLLGLYSIKEELEELAFKYSNPEAHRQMLRRMATLSKDQDNIIQSVSTLPVNILPCAP